MGGFGSGRRAKSKYTTSSFRALDIRRLQSDGVLQPGCISAAPFPVDGAEAASIELRSEPDRVWLTYILRRGPDCWQSPNFPVTVERTPCHYGGSRPWFRCPLNGCGRRVAILYAGAVFACRHCYRLGYPSQREALHARALRRTRAIRVKLGGSPSFSQPFPAKPKGMHRRTYRRLRSKAHQAEQQNWPPWLLKALLAAAQNHPAAKPHRNRRGGPVRRSGRVRPNLSCTPGRAQHHQA